MGKQEGKLAGWETEQIKKSRHLPSEAAEVYSTDCVVVVVSSYVVPSCRSEFVVLDCAVM